MSSYEANSRVKNLSERIRLLKDPRHIDRVDEEVADKNQLWRLADLLVNLISNGRLQYKEPSFDDLHNFYNTYTGNRSFTLQDLKEKHWLRIIMRRVEFPSAVWGAIHDIKKGIHPNLDIFLELESLISKSSSTFLTKTELENFIKDYNLRNSNQIDFETIEKGFISKDIRKDEYTIRLSGEYFLILNNNRGALEFIEAFREKYNIREHNSLLIDVEKIKQICLAQKSLYADCPSYEDFKISGFFVEQNDEVQIKLYHNNYFSSLCNEIAGRLWNKYKTDTSFTNDNDRLDCWLDIILLFNGYPLQCLKYINIESQESFLDLIQTHLTSDEDISDSKAELNKLWLEASIGRTMDVLTRKFELSFDDSQSPLQMFLLYKRIRDRQHNLFDTSDCRKRLNFLTHILINTGEITESPIFSYPRVITILRNSIHKPYLLWRIVHLIIYVRPEIVPRLLLENGFEEIGMSLMVKFDLNSTAISACGHDEIRIKIRKLRDELVVEGFTILLHVLSSGNSIESGTLIAHLLERHAAKLYIKPHNDYALAERTEDFRLYNTLWNLLANFRVSGLTYHAIDTLEHPLYFSSVARGFLEALTDRTTQTEPLNELYRPEVHLIDICLRLISTLQNPVHYNTRTLYESVTSNIDSIIIDAINFIHGTYKSFFTLNSITTRSDTTEPTKETELRFLSDSYKIEQIDWAKYLQLLSNPQKREFFNLCSTNFDFSLYPDFNNISIPSDIETSANKLRFHLRVLLSVFNSFNERLSFDDTGLQCIIETELTNMFCDYSKTDVSKNQFDIFSIHIGMYSGVDLMEDYFEAVNFFKERNRRRIIDKLIENEENLDRVLKGLSIFSSEQDKEYLITKLSEEKVNSFLDRQYYRPEIMGALINTVNNSALTSYAEQILHYLEELDKNRKHEDFDHVKMLFEIKLVIAYRKNDLASLDSTPIPESAVHLPNHERLYLEALKSYFRACILWIRHDLLNAQKIIDRIAINENIDFRVLNSRFALQIEIAKEQYKGDLNKMRSSIAGALEIIEAIELHRDHKINDTDKRLLLVNKLECYDILEWDEKFDLTYPQIKRIDRYSKEYAELFIANKVRREQLFEASTYLVRLKKYHTHRSGEIPSFITELELKLNMHEKGVAYISSAYHLMLGLSEEDRIKALPDIITKQKSNYGIFLLGEIATACISFQKKLFSQLKKGDYLNALEDKITDILEALINARLSAWGLSVSSQNRIGTTGSDTHELARADLTSSEGRNTIIFEALRIYSYSSLNGEAEEINSHIKKAFNETPTRKYFFHVIYYQADKFTEDWKAFKNDILPTVSFPIRFSLLSKAQDLTDLSTSDLKVAFTTHSEDVTLYYVFMNLNYPVSFVSKIATALSKVGRKKK